MPTKISKKKAAKKSKPNWILSLYVSEGSNLLPQVTLCGERDSITMKVLDPTPTDNILSYQVSLQSAFFDNHVSMSSGFRRYRPASQSTSRNRPEPTHERVAGRGRGSGAAQLPLHHKGERGGHAKFRSRLRCESMTPSTGTSCGSPRRTWSLLTNSRPMNSLRYGPTNRLFPVSSTC